MEFLIWAAVLILAGALAWLVLVQRRSSAPQLTCTLFPLYDVPDLILVGGLLVENRGSAPARNVKVEIEYDRTDSARIQHMHVECDDPYVLRAGGEKYSFATIRLRVLRPHKLLFVFWSAGKEFRPRVNVTSYPKAEGGLRVRVGRAGSAWLRGLHRERTDEHS